MMCVAGGNVPFWYRATLHAALTFLLDLFAQDATWAGDNSLSLNFSLLENLYLV